MHNPSLHFQKFWFTEYEPGLWEFALTQGSQVIQRPVVQRSYPEKHFHWLPDLKEHFLLLELSLLDHNVYLSQSVHEASFLPLSQAPSLEPGL